MFNAFAPFLLPRFYFTRILFWSNCKDPKLAFFSSQYLYIFDGISRHNKDFRDSDASDTKHVFRTFLNAMRAGKKRKKEFRYLPEAGGGYILVILSQENMNYVFCGFLVANIGAPKAMVFL